MTLVIDLCEKERRLSQEEFVNPIARIVTQSGEDPSILHYSDLGGGIPASEGSAILCGTALHDTGYLEHLGYFKQAITGNLPLLGICAGMQVIAMLFGGEIRAESETGMTSIQVIGNDPLCEGRREFEAYELHTLSVTPPTHFHILARSSRCIQIMRHPISCIYGVMFHPEVRNTWVVERFLACARACNHERE